MEYIFDLCPKCKDRLIERTVKDFEKYDEIYCSNCGSKMETVFFGGRKVEVDVFQIILTKVKDMKGRRDRCVEAIMEIGNFSKTEAMEKLDTENSIIFEGDLLNTYLRLRCLDKIDYMIDYTVNPKFPYARRFVEVCPDCEEETVYKQEKISEDKIKAGCYCEKCSDWLWYDIRDKSWYDKTVYHLKISLKEVEGKVRQDVLKMTDGLRGKEMIEDQIVVRDLARNIGTLLGVMRAYDINYEVFPPYPYKIIELKKEGICDDIYL